MYQRMFIFSCIQTTLEVLHGITNPTDKNKPLGKLYKLYISSANYPAISNDHYASLKEGRRKCLLNQRYIKGMGRWERGWDLLKSYSWKSSTDPKVQQIQCPLKAKVHYDDHKLPKSTCLQWQNKVSDLFYFRMASKSRLKLLLMFILKDHIWKIYKKQLILQLW